MDFLFQQIEKFNGSILWGIPMVILMLGTGLYLIIVTKGILFRRFNTVLRHTVKTLFLKPSDTISKNGTISPFQAVCTALAGTVGTGNIIGVALAIAAGGPGSVFWLWISALIGMTVKYSEVTLAVAYRQKDPNGHFCGGPMYYMTHGLQQKWLAVLFSVCGAVAAFGIGAAVQSNSIATGLQDTFQLPPQATAIVISVLAGLVVIGGIRRIAGVAEWLVPFMALFYMVGSIAVLIVNSEALPGAVASIFRDAFTGTAATGGFLGASVRYACRIGFARGVFTHEAGMGSAPIAHAEADTDHPARQGLWGAFEVFFDSIVMCTVTALVILTSGLWKNSSGFSGGNMCAAAFAQAIPYGQYIVSIGLVLFAFATVIAWYHYGEKCLGYLFPRSQLAVIIYKTLYIGMVYAGCVTGLEAVWELADLFNGLMAIPNLTALILLAPRIRDLTKDFFDAPDKRCSHFPPLIKTKP